jgi:hypothetical protein
LDKIIIREKAKVGRRNGYKLIDNSNIFIETFEKFDSDNDIGWVFDMLQESDLDIFKDLAKYTNTDKNMYIFKSNPFEYKDILEKKDIFKKLKVAIKNSEYRKIQFKTKDVIDNLRCLRFVFVDNNWYLAYVDNSENLRLGRISFIESVEDATNKKYFYIRDVQSHLDFLKNDLQNSMTLFNKSKKIAKIKATKNISHYF